MPPIPLRNLKTGGTTKQRTRLIYSNTRRACHFSAHKRRQARRGLYTLALHEPLTLRILNFFDPPL